MCVSFWGVSVPDVADTPLPEKITMFLHPWARSNSSSEEVVALEHARHQVGERPRGRGEGVFVQQQLHVGGGG